MDGNGTHRVLLVDDNMDGAQLMGELVSMLGYEVQVEYSGIKALEAAKSWKPQIVILDIGMPEMDGYEVAARLRSMPETKDAVLIALTGWGQMEFKEQQQSTEFNYHLVKPVDIETLESKLKEVSATL